MPVLDRVYAEALAEQERRRREQSAQHAGGIEALKEQARQGNPFPLIKVLWPTAKLDAFQKDLLWSAFSPQIKEVFIKGATGCGKGAASSLAAAVYFLVYEDAKVIITSNTADHATDVMYGDVCKWLKTMAVSPLVDLPITGYAESKEHYIVVVNPKDDESFSGRHGEHVCFVFDESSGIPDGRFEMARSQAKKIIAASNPRTRFGAFRDAFPKVEPDRTQTIWTEFGWRRVITIGGGDCLNVRRMCLEKPVAPRGGITIRGVKFAQGRPIPDEFYVDVKPIIPGQICFDKYLGLLANKDPMRVRVYAQGMFPTEDRESQVIPTSDVERGAQRFRKLQEVARAVREYAERRAQRAAAGKGDGAAAEPVTPEPARKPWVVALFESLQEITGFGLDVAASEDGDRTVLTPGGPGGLQRQHVWQDSDTMRIAQRVIDVAKSKHSIDLKRGVIPVAVDMDGLGKGVGDRLRQLGVRVLEIRGNATCRNPRQYVNSRAEFWGEFAERLDSKGDGVAFFALPDDPELMEELAAPDRIFQGNDGLRYAITPKTRRPGSTYRGQTLGEILGRSPDKGDSAVYCWQAIRCGVRALQQTRRVMVLDDVLAAMAARADAASEFETGADE